MALDSDNTRLRLEGLVLCDEDGTLYEVPRVVIERYRMVESPLRPETDAARSDGDGATVGVHQPAPWIVRSGVYVTASSTPPLRL